MRIQLEYSIASDLSLSCVYPPSVYFSQHSMIIEYVGAVIRNEVANKRECAYNESVSSALSECVTLMPGE